MSKQIFICSKPGARGRDYGVVCEKFLKWYIGYSVAITKRDKANVFVNVKVRYVFDCHMKIS